MSRLGRWKWPVLIAALAGAAALALWGDKRPAGVVQASREADPARLGRPMARPAPAQPAAAAAAGTAAPALHSLAPRQASAPPATNPFAVTLDAAPPVARPAPAQLPPAAPTLVAPPYVFQGKQRIAGRWEVFLVRDEQVHIVQVGTVLDRNWRVDLIQPPTLTLTDLGTQQRFSIPIGDTP